MEGNNITIMVVRQSGKIRTAKISPKKLYIFFIGITGLILTFLVILYGYIKVYQENTDLTKTVRAILEEQEAASVEKSPSAEEYQAADTADSSDNKEWELSNDSIESSLSSAEISHAAITNHLKEDIISEKVSIDQFKTTVSENPRRLKFFFRLDNIERDGPLSGFLAVTGISSEGRGERFIVYPAAPMKADGEIADYKQGEWFSIRRFKFIQGHLPIDGDVKEYSTLVVFVYSVDGELLFRQTLDMIHKSP